MVEIMLVIMFFLGYMTARESNERPIEFDKEFATCMLLAWALTGLLSWFGILINDNGFGGCVWL